MMGALSESAESEAAMRAQILVFLEEYCRSMTLRDAREWYAEALAADGHPGAV
jgi:hypothetical protein